MKRNERVSLGILAGGRGSRLNGVDKAFARYENEYLCQRILNRLDTSFAETLISARENDERFSDLNLKPVFDTREPFSGPLAGIEALLYATKSEFLLTVPVDIKYLPTVLIQEWLDNPESPGMVLQDADGLQPLVALWHVEKVRDYIKLALDKHNQAVHALVRQLQFTMITRTDIQIGNLNTPRDFDIP